MQTSLAGSILSNLLIVMGCCFFFGGLRRKEQYFNQAVSQTAASMLALSVASLIIPAVFDAQNNTPSGNVAKISRGTSVLLLLAYACYLLFQLKTHQSVFAEKSQKVPVQPWVNDPVHRVDKHGSISPDAVLGHDVSLDIGGKKKGGKEEEEEEEEESQLHFFVAIGTLAISTVIIAVCAEFMVGGIDSVTKSGGLSEEFFSLLLLPIVGNAAEHATAVTVAIKDKMDLAIGVAVGSSM